MSSISSSTHKPSLGPTSASDFDPQSPGYQAVWAAAQGSFSEVQTILREDRDLINRLHVVSAEPLTYLSAMHYAANHEQWKVAALLINAGMNWNLHGENNGRPTRSAVKVLGSKEGALVEVFKQFCSDDFDTIDVDSLLPILLSDEMPVIRRQEVIQNLQLCRDFSAKVDPSKAMIVMALLMKGSFKLGGYSEKSDFSDLVEGNCLPVNAKITSPDFICYCSYLAGIKDLSSIDAHFKEDLNQVRPLSESDFRKINNPNECLARRERLMMPSNVNFSKKMGLPPVAERTKLKPPFLRRGPPIQCFATTSLTGFVAHYGIIFKFGDKGYVVHLNHFSPDIGVEVVPPLSYYNQVQSCKKLLNIYSFVPWFVQKQ